MSIIPSTDYLAFRNAFPASPATTANDGMPTFASATRTFRPFTNHEFDAVNGITIDFTGGADDATAGVDEWHGWISDPAAATGAPRWQLTRADPSPPLVTRSGRFTLSLTAAGVAIYEPDADVVGALLHQVSLYVYKLSSNATYWSDLYRCAFAPESFSANFTVVVT